MGKPVITPEIAAYISANYLNESSTSMGAKCGIDKSTVQRYMRRSGLRVPFYLSLKFRSEAMKGRTTFSAVEDQYIRDNYMTVPIKVMGKTIGRSFTGIMGRITAMGLTIPQELREKRKKIGQIQPGSVSFNKGKKQSDYMSPEAVARTAKTRFKKGDLPHNTAPGNGEIRIRDNNRNPYQYIRISLAKWVLLHKYNWEKINGPVPAGYCLRSIDGNTLNAAPSNWKLITRKENRIINSGTVTLPDSRVAYYLSPTDKDFREQIMQHPELIKLKRAQLLLNRKINETTAI